MVMVARMHDGTSMEVPGRVSPASLNTTFKLWDLNMVMCRKTRPALFSGTQALTNAMQRKYSMKDVIL